MQFPDEPPIEQPLSLIESCDEAVVIANLVDPLFVLRGVGESVADFGIKRVWLLAKYMQVAIESGANDFRVISRRGRDEHTIQLLLREHLPVIRVRFYAGIFRKDVEDVTRRIANGGQLYLWMYVDHGLMGQAHFSEPDDCSSKHQFCSVRLIDGHHAGAARSNGYCTRSVPQRSRAGSRFDSKNKFTVLRLPAPERVGHANLSRTGKSRRHPFCGKFCAVGEPQEGTETIGRRDADDKEARHRRLELTAENRCALNAVHLLQQICIDERDA